MLIFRKLEKAVLQVISNLKDQNFFEEDKQLEKRKYDALMEIAQYVRTFSWVSHKESIERLKYFLNSKMNYAKTAERFGVSQNSIEASVSHFGKKLNKLIGEKTIDLIIQGEKIDQAMTQFRLGTNREKHSDWFIEGVIDLFPKKFEKDNLLGLDDCTRELNCLTIFTRQYLQKIIESCDQKKLSHILYILHSTDGKVVSERHVLSQLFKGKFNHLEDGSVVPPSNQVKKAIVLLQVENIFYSE